LQVQLAPLDNQGMVDLLDGIIPLLDQYDKALAKLKPTSFKGKTPSEQTTNFTKAKEQVGIILGIAKKARTTKDNAQNPMAYLSKNYKAVFAKFNQIKGDNAALQKFYSAEFRNTLGTAIGAASKLPLGKDVLADFAKFDAHGKIVNSLLNAKDGVPIDYAKARLEMAKALAVIHQHMN
jgi:hypothetical protein